MNFRRLLIAFGALLILIEIICFALAPSAVDLAQPDPALQALEYIPYIMTAMTLAFVSVLTLALVFIVLMLRSELKKNAVAMVVLFLAFILPLVLYYALY